MLGRNVLEATVGDGALFLGDRERLDFRRLQRIQSRPEALSQVLDRRRLQQARERQSQLDAIRLMLRPDLRRSPVLRTPPDLDLVDAGSGALAAAEHREHLLQARIPALADSATQVLFYRNQQATGVRQHDAIREALDHDAASGRVIRMHDRIDERLAKGLVRRRLVLARHSLEAKRRRQGVRDLRPDASVELEQVGLPGAVRVDAVGPASVGIELLPVVDEVGGSRHRIADRGFPTEHQQRSECQALRARGPIPAPAAQSLEELDIGQAVPGVPFVHQAEQSSVLIEALRIEVFEGEVFEHARVAWFCRGVRQHAAHFVVTAAVAPFVLSSEGVAERVGPQVHRAHASVGARHPHDEQLAFAHGLDVHVAGRQQVSAHLVTVVQTVPEVLLVPVYLLGGQPVERHPTAMFARAEHDRTALGVGHRRVGLPEAAGQAALRGLELPVGAFADVCRLQDLFAGDHCCSGGVGGPPQRRNSYASAARRP